MSQKLIDRYGNEFERLKLMFTVVERGKGDSVVKELRHLGVTYNMVSVTYGAVGVDLRDMLGLTETEGEIVISVLTESKVRAVLSMVEYKFSMHDPGKGFAFCIPIEGVGGPLSLRYISGMEERYTDSPADDSV